MSRAARLTLLDETGLSFRDAHWREDLAAWLGRDLGAGRPALLARRRSRGRTVERLVRARGMVVVPASTASVAGIAHRAVEGPAAAGGRRHPQGAAAAGRGAARDAAHPQHAGPPADAGRPGRDGAAGEPGVLPRTQGVQQLVDFVAGKVLDVLGVEHALFTRWGGELGSAAASQSPD